MSKRDEFTQSAESTPFDNSTNGFDADDAQAAIEEARDGIKGKVSVQSFQTLSRDSWFGYGHVTITSNEVPLVIVADAKISGFSYVNAVNNTDIDIEVYQNGTLKFTQEIRNKRFAFDSNIGPYQFSIGDRVSVFARRVDTGTGDPNPDDMVVRLTFVATSNTGGSGGQQTGV